MPLRQQDPDWSLSDPEVESDDNILTDEELAKLPEIDDAEGLVESPPPPEDDPAAATTEVPT